MASPIAKVRLKPGYANDGASFVNTTATQSALRDLRLLRSHLFKPSVLAVLALVWLMATIAGPFDTLNDFVLPDRAIYWGLVVFSTYTAGGTVTALVGTRICARVKPVALALGLTAFAISLAVFGVLNLINTVFVDDWWAVAHDLVPIYLFVFLISLAIVVIRHVTLGEVGIPEPAPPRILDRVSLDKRGALLSLSVQDHYVDIHTDKGREMVLMRLSDAMREADEVPGLQVHRSHWVALDAIAKAQRTSDTARLTLIDGTEVPVSRGFLPAVRAAGLLPKGKPATGGRR